MGTDVDTDVDTEPRSAQAGFCGVSSRRDDSKHAYGNRLMHVRHDHRLSPKENRCLGSVATGLPTPLVQSPVPEAGDLGRGSAGATAPPLAPHLLRHGITFLAGTIVPDSGRV